MKTHDLARWRELFRLSAAACFIAASFAVRSADNDTSDFHPLNLSKFYNKTTNAFEPGTSWAAVPWGRQTFAGVPFEMSGTLEVTGMGATQSGQVFAGRYSGIPVGRKAGWIHLLHGTGYADQNGTPIARITLNYESGEKRSFNIRYGVHVRNWWVERSEKVADLSDPNSKVAWTGTSRQTDPSGVTLRLCQTSFQNPLPDDSIKSIDFSSLFSRATPVIVAMTVGEAGNAKPVPASSSQFFTINLTNFYGRSFELLDQDPTSSWAHSPHGRQVFEGIPFEMHGIMEVAGLRPAREGRFHPASVKGIPVDRKVTRLHVLHGAGENLTNDTPIAKLVFHYADGKEHTAPIVYGRNVRNWWKSRTDPDEVTDPNTKVIWRGSSPASDRYGTTLRIFRSSFDLPSPDVELKSIDVVSLMSASVSVITAMTVESGGADPAVPGLAKAEPAESIDEAGLRAETLVRVEDVTTGKPIANARVRLNVEDEKATYFFGEQTTDARGATAVEYPSKQITRMSLAVIAPGYATLFHNVSISDLKKELGLKLARGVTVGGLVKDQNGKPVAEAKVIVSAVARDEVGQFVLSEYDSAQSDSSGKWSSSALPSDFKSLSLEITHPRFMPGEFEQGERDNLEGKTFSKESLLAGKAVLVLEPGIAVAGVVADSAGKAIADAEVALTDLGETPKKQIVRTDSKGGFSFVSTQAGEFHLVVQAKGYAPGYKPVEAERDLKPIQFALVKATPLKGQVVDNTGKPVAGATVALQSWNELQLLNWSAATDAEGRFIWDSAPDSAANFSATKPGYNTVAFSPGAGDEQTITMTQAFRLAGKVVDAETKEPIKSFNLIPGRSWGMADEENARWERHEQKSGSNGHYEMTLDYPQGGQVKFMAIADGYLPAATPLMSETGWHTHDFELKKGSGPKGIVQSPDGKPVEGAQVVILGVGYLSLSKTAFNNPNPNDAFLVKTDAEGSFSLPAVVASPTIVAVHEKGYAEIKGDDLAGAGKIVLQPWGRIEGVARTGRKPWADQELMLSDRGFGNGLNYDWSAFKVTTDAEGRFAFENVPPGERQLVRLVKTSERSWVHSHITPITVKAGEALKVIFGGTGRTLTGKAVLSDPTRKVDFNMGHHSFGTRQPRSPRTFKTAEEYREWEKTPEVKEARKNHRYYALRFDPNGVFRIENVPSGTYDLNIRLHEPGKDEWRPGEMIGSASKEIIVDEIPGGVSDEPFDVGELTIQLKADLKVGGQAPAFEVKTVDGKPLKLSDYRGKYVLLDFWATWCGPCVAELPHLKSTYESFGKDERFAMIGLSLDPQTKEPEEFTKKNEMKWIQGFLGEWSQTQLPASYGVNGIPATFLLDPDGKIVAKNLRGGAIREAVAAALGEPSKAALK